MSIYKEITTNNGVTINHFEVEEININNKNNESQIIVRGYISSTDYNEGKSYICEHGFRYYNQENPFIDSNIINEISVNNKTFIEIAEDKLLTEDMFLGGNKV